MFDDFKKAVLDSYAEKKATNQLSDNLMKPTRVNLKNECLDILRKRYHKKDDETIKAFFDPNSKFDNHEQRIKEFDPDSYKAISNFFLGKANIRKDENIKLLAWLIDFEPRPYVFGETYRSTEIKDEISIPPPTPNPSAPVTKVPWRKLGIASFFLMILVVLGLTKYTSGEGKTKSSPNKENSSITDLPKKELPINQVRNGEETNSSTTATKQQCMYWTGDEYKAISCNETVDDTPIIAIDKQKMIRLKRITRPDTLGNEDLSKTWYVKINVDSIEFYTDSGSYPIDTKKRLKPLTSYMLTKYPRGYNILKK